MARKSSVERANEIAGGFATAQKNIFVQYGNKERRTDEMLQLIKRDVLSKGFKDSEFDKINIYIKPEEQKVFYVINDDYSGSIDF